MERKVYRSLDRPVAFFGIRGRYMSWVVIGLVVDLVLSFIIGALTVGIIGFICFLGLAIGIYLYVISFQERMSDRELEKKMNSRRIATCIKRSPQTVRRILTSYEDKKQSNAS